MFVSRKIENVVIAAQDNSQRPPAGDGRSRMRPAGSNLEDFRSCCLVGTYFYLASSKSRKLQKFSANANPDNPPRLCNFRPSRGVPRAFSCTSCRSAALGVVAGLHSYVPCGICSAVACSATGPPLAQSHLHYRLHHRLRHRRRGQLRRHRHGGRRGSPSHRRGRLEPRHLRA